MIPSWPHGLYSSGSTGRDAWDRERRRIELMEAEALSDLPGGLSAAHLKRSPPLHGHGVKKNAGGTGGGPDGYGRLARGLPASARDATLGDRSEAEREAIQHEGEHEEAFDDQQQSEQ